ncbi:MAG: hypothetical protein KKI02_06180 [Planctomycetes bacterium]|nr:hypothetical protein [Planctomycetota bacterium]
MLGVDWARGQQVQARVVAHPGPATNLPTEPAIAAGEHAIVALFFAPAAKFAGWHKSFYASRLVGGKRWARHPIEGGYQDVVDVSVAYEGATGAFLAAATVGSDIVTCRFEPGSTPGELIPGAWTALEREPGPVPVDKPWILAGSYTLPSGQEYYIVYFGDVNKYYYFHSVNGGQSWQHERIVVGEHNLTGAWCAQPAVHDDGPLYVAYVAGDGNAIRFLVGEDQPDGTVSFAHLLQTAVPPVPAGISLREDEVHEKLPGAFNQYVARTVPYLAVDPSDRGNLYVAYHDVAQTNPNDVDVYLRKLTKSGDVWTVGPERRVNTDDPAEQESDQFMPMLTVDDAGRLHVLFYDDRRHEQDDTDSLAMFDAFYAYSVNEGADWTNRYLYLNDENDPNDPPALFRQSSEAGHRGNPREYNGIAWYRYPDGVKILTAYTGTDEEDPDDNDGTIWSSVIEWPN